MQKPLRHHVHDYFFTHPRNNYRPHFFSMKSVAVVTVLILLVEAVFLAQGVLMHMDVDLLALITLGVHTTPYTVTALILSAVFAAIAVLISATFTRHWRIPHPQVFLSGAILLVITLGLIIINTQLLSIP